MHSKDNNEYKHLSQEERTEIGIWLREGLSIRGIAKKLGRSHTTINILNFLVFLIHFLIIN